MKFSQIIGHTKNIEILLKIINGGKIFHSYLFTGIDGIGKKMVALAFAKHVLCIGKKNDECICESCRMFLKGVHPDFRLVDKTFQASLLGEEPEEQDNIKISTIREIIRFSQLAPSFSKYKIIVFEDAHKIVIEAQNALLKTIEEPTPTTLFIFITHTKNLLLPTVVSRSQILNFTSLKVDDVIKILKDRGFDEKISIDAAESSGGSVSFAIKHIDILNEIKESLEYGQLAPFVIASKLSKSQNPKQSAFSLIDILNNRIYYLVEKNLNRNIIERANLIIKKNLKYKQYLRYNVSPRIISFLVLYKYFLFRKELKEIV
ncbi:MAG: DNA polymerase III subunit delta' [Elusimicrobiales bacterium]|nr:DNA polymerase III subunit delta' [Elusimicrobiales bacterium]